jgi:uncharacterized surface protein with fasciclin (FAS1) repeats
MKPIGFTMIVALFSFAALVPAQAPAFAELTVEVGGAPMRPSRNIIENAIESKDHTAFVAALKAADLIEVLQGAGPFTVFAPVNKAFEKLPKGALDALLKPEAKAALTEILTYHVIPGKYSAADFIAAIKKSGGKAALKTLEGEDLSVEIDGRKLIVVDAKGGQAIVTIPDVNQKNGMVHVVDAVLSPKNRSPAAQPEPLPP